MKITRRDLEPREFEHLLDYMLQNWRLDPTDNCPTNAIYDIEAEAECDLDWCPYYLPTGSTSGCPCYVMENCHTAVKMARDWVESRKILFRRFYNAKL